MLIRLFDPKNLAKDADNYDVFCERCQKVHKYYTYTQEDHARVVSEGAKAMADDIDRRIAEDVYRAFSFPPFPAPTGKDPNEPE